VRFEAPETISPRAALKTCSAAGTTPSSISGTWRSTEWPAKSSIPRRDFLLQGGGPPLMSAIVRGAGYRPGRFVLAKGRTPLADIPRAVSRAAAVGTSRGWLLARQAHGSGLNSKLVTTTS
jgi:hypothetical protein